MLFSFEIEDLFAILNDRGRIIMHNIALRHVLPSVMQEKITIKDISPSKGWELLVRQDKLNKRYLFKAARENPAPWKKTFSLKGNPGYQVYLEHDMGFDRKDRLTSGHRKRSSAAGARR